MHIICAVTFSLKGQFENYQNGPYYDAGVFHTLLYSHLLILAQWKLAYVYDFVATMDSNTTFWIKLID